MTDISMCRGASCQQRDNCYRYRAKSDGEDQSYGNFDQNLSRNEPCSFFWHIDKAEAPLEKKKGRD